MKKEIRRLIGIKRLKREGRRYLYIAEKIKEFTDLTQPLPRRFTFPVDDLVLVDEDMPMVRIPKWRQRLTRAKVYFGKLFIKMRRVWLGNI